MVRAIGVHHVNSRSRVSPVTEDDLSAVGTEGRFNIVSCECKARLIAPVRIHHVNLRAPVAVRLEGNLVAGRTNGWKIVKGRVVGKPRSVCPVRVHHINLIVPIAVGRKGDLRARRDIDRASHANAAVRRAEVGIIACLRKSMLINRALTGKNSQVAVRVIRGTEQPIGGARRTAGDAVAAAAPGPPYRVTCENVDCGRYELKTVSNRADSYIEGLALRQRNAARCVLTVLIDNADDPGFGLLLCR